MFMKAKIELEVRYKDTSFFGLFSASTFQKPYTVKTKTPVLGNATHVLGVKLNGVPRILVFF